MTRSAFHRFFIACLLALPLFGLGQDLTGTWEGVLTGEHWGRSNQYAIRLELVQIGREVHGNLSIKNEKTDSVAQVNYLLSGELDKKVARSFRLIRDGIYDTDYPQAMAEYFNELLVEWTRADSARSRLRGFWFPNMGPGTMPNGAAGKYTVVRTSTTVHTESMQAWMKAKAMEAKL